MRVFFLVDVCLSLCVVCRLFVCVLIVVVLFVISLAIVTWLFMVVSYYLW